MPIKEIKNGQEAAPAKEPTVESQAPHTPVLKEGELNNPILEMLLNKVKQLEDRLRDEGWKKSGAVGDSPVFRSSTELDADDMLEVPEVFFCFTSRHSMYGYTKDGHAILTPYNRPIVFERFNRFERPSRDGRGMDTISVSRCVVYSKKEAAWIKEHPDFDIRVFANINKASNIDATLAEKMASYAGLVNSLDDHQMIRRAQAEGLTIHDSPRKLRQELIQHLAKKEISMSRVAMKEMMQEMADVKSKKNADTPEGNDAGANPY